MNDHVIYFGALCVCLDWAGSVLQVFSARARNESKIGGGAIFRHEGICLQEILVALLHRQEYLKTEGILLLCSVSLFTSSRVEWSFILGLSVLVVQRKTNLVCLAIIAD